MKNIALVHDWLLEIGGAEKVLEAIQSQYSADLHTLFSNQEGVTTSFLNKLPYAHRYYRSLLPLYPLAIESFDLRGYPLVLSSSHAVASRVKTDSDQLHICYCHTPMRYLWDLKDEYLATISSSLKRGLARICLSHIKRWDRTHANRPDVMIANSYTVADRIKRHYGREVKKVIYPPVDVNRFQLNLKKESYFVTSSRLVPYKRVDLLVNAFSYLTDETLVVIGDGPMLSQLKAIATQNVHFIGRCSDERVVELVSKAKGYLYGAMEDFGIAPVEAMSCGTPVIAYAKGGTGETVIDCKTGLHFGEQTVESVVRAIQRYLRLDDQFSFEYIASYAQRFSKERFIDEYREVVESESTHFGRRQREAIMASFNGSGS